MRVVKNTVWLKSLKSRVEANVYGSSRLSDPTPKWSVIFSVDGTACRALRRSNLGLVVDI